MTRLRSSALALLLLWASLSHAAIALDGPCTVSGATDDYGPDTFTHTTTTANVLAVCTHTLGASDSVNTIATVTHNTDALTSLLSANNGANGTVTLWTRLAPDLGAGLTVVVTPTSDPYYINVACGFAGVDQVTPTHTQTSTATGTTISATVTSAVGELALSCATITPEVTTITEGAGETMRWSTGHNELHGFGSTMAGTASSVTPDLTFDGPYFASQVVVSFAPLVLVGGAHRQSVVTMP